LKGTELVFFGNFIDTSPFDGGTVDYASMLWASYREIVEDRYIGKGTGRGGGRLDENFIRA